MPEFDVYFVLSMETHRVKIGYAKDAWSRLSNMQVGSAEELRMLGIIRTYLPYDLERDLHERFCSLRVRGEWFSLSDELVDYVAEHCDPWERDE